MNKLGFGFLRLPVKNGRFDREKVNELVDCFMEGGGRYFDTCYTYLNGESEAAVRECVVKRKPRNSFQLAEKLPGYMCRSYEDCQKYFEQELVRCGVDYFDVFMLHREEMERFLKALDQLDEKYALPLRLWIFGQFSEKEISEIIDANYHTVRTRITRERKLAGKIYLAMKGEEPDEDR